MPWQAHHVTPLVHRPLLPSVLLLLCARVCRCAHLHSVSWSQAGPLSPRNSDMVLGMAGQCWAAEVGQATWEKQGSGVASSPKGPCMLG